jgi:hypothetical protein
MRAAVILDTESIEVEVTLQLKASQSVCHGQCGRILSTAP